MDKKTVMITGANRGIGLEFVNQYLKKGWFVVACCRNKEKARALKEFTREYQDTLFLLEMNVADEKSIAHAARSFPGITGRIDLLINNAGTNADEKGLETVSMAGMIQVFSVNTFGPVVVTKHFLPYLKKSPKPLTASLYSGTSLIKQEKYKKGGQYSYAASKAALNMLIKCMAADLEEAGICVIGIGPGFVLTDLTRTSPVKPPLLPEESVEHMIRTIEARDINDSGKIFEYNGEEVVFVI